VIGESLKNANDSQCFKCQGYVYIAAQCPSKNFLVRRTNLDVDGLDTVIREPFESLYDTDEDVRDSSTQLGVIRCLHTVVRDENWGTFSVFHTYVLHEGKNYKLIIDGGSCANIIVKKTLEKMGLKAKPHPLIQRELS